MQLFIFPDQGCQDGSAGGSAAIHEISIEIIHLILTQLKEDSEQFGVESSLIESFLNILRKGKLQGKLSLGATYSARKRNHSCFSFLLFL